MSMTSSHLLSPLVRFSASVDADVDAVVEMLLDYYCRCYAAAVNSLVPLRWCPHLDFAGFLHYFVAPSEPDSAWD